MWVICIELCGYVFAFVNQHSCLCFRCVCELELHYMCMHAYVCVQLHRRCSVWGRGLLPVQLRLGSVSQLCVFLLRFSQNPIITTSWRHHWCHLALQTSYQAGKPRRELSRKGTKVREKENAEVGEGEREAQASQAEQSLKSLWGRCGRQAEAGLGGGGVWGRRWPVWIK